MKVKNKHVFKTFIILASSLLLNGAAIAEDTLLKQGEKVFNELAGIGCKSCHGEYAEGDLGVGPFIRGATEGSIRAAIEGTGEMVVIQLTIKEDEIKAVAAYVNSLGRTQVVRTLSKRGRFIPEKFIVHPGTDIQLVIKNSSVKPHTYASDNLEIEPFEIAGRSTGSLIWRSPDKEGSYKLQCTDCKLMDQFFTIEVSSKAKQFIPTKPNTKLTKQDAEM